MLCSCFHTCRLDNNTTLYLMLDVLDSEEEETIVKVGHVQSDLFNYDRIPPVSDIHFLT